MPKDKHTAPAGAAKTAKKGGGTAPWTLGLGWLFSFLLVILAALLMLLTTLCSAGYMKSRVSACGYGETAYVTMREQFIGYGAATGFSEETMTTVLDPVQIEQDMKDSIDGLYAKSPYRYDRPAIAERAYAAMEAEAAEKGITLEGDTAANVQVVAEAVRQVYASATAVPLVSQLYTILQKVRTVLLIGIPICLVFTAMAGILMLRISRRDALLGARSLSFSLGGAGIVCAVIGFAVAPSLGLTRLNLSPQALKDLLVSYVSGMFERFVLFAVIYLVLAVVVALLLHPRHKSAQGGRKAG